MSRVVVVHPPSSIARDFIDYPYMSDLGAVQVAAVLRERGHDVRLVDAFALPGSGLSPRDDGRLHLGAPVGDVVERIEACDVAVVAYTPFHRPPRRDDVLGDLLAEVRKRSKRVILADCYQSGQHYVEAEGDAVLASYPEVDAWVKYEGETTLPELIESVARGVHRGVDVEDLDALPFPAWDLVDLAARDAFEARVVRDLGRGAWAFPTDGRTLPVITSRGCPFRCAHCSSNPGREPGAPKTQRRLSVERMSALFEQLKRVHGATRLEVLDELVNVNERHFEGFLDAIETFDVKFDVPNGMRADYLFAEHLRRMRGRVQTVSISAESGVQRVVSEVVGKRLDLANITRVAEDAHREGVALMIHFMIGLPGETAGDVNGTLAYALDLYDRFDAFPAVQFATPLPGTELARGRKLPVVSDWGPHFQTAPSQPDAGVPADVLRRFRATLDQRLTASRAPQKLVVNATNVCNNRCSFCAVGTGSAAPGHPPRQRESLTEHRARGVRVVEFDGGEPTMNPELIALVHHARSVGYERVTVTTNGRMCFYESFAKKLVRSGASSIFFSVQGPDPTTHGEQVGVAEAFEQTVGGIRHCVKHAPPGVELGMNTAVTRGNCDKLEQLAELALQLGLTSLTLQFIAPTGPAVSRAAPDTQMAADAAMRVIDRFRDRLKVRVVNLPFCFAPGYEVFLAGDPHKIERRSVFTIDEESNFPPHLATRRTPRAVCRSCPHACFCGGFHELNAGDERSWLIEPAKLVRAPDRVDT